MATRTTLAARTTAVLTGGATVDYAADLDMNLTEDGEVTVEVTPTIGGLVSLTLTLHSGDAATPTGPMTNGGAALSMDLATLTTVMVSTTVRTNQRYFRAAVTGAGGAAAGSDAVINYYYRPRAGALVMTSLQGAPTINHS